MDSEENKMKTSDTPRSDAAEYLQYDTEPPLPLGLVDVEFARKLEIELNTAIANEAFAENKAYMLEKELKQAQDRIKRLEDVLQTACYLIANVDWSGLYPDLREICYSWRDNDLRPVLKEMVQRKNKEAKP
jgi:hypothetical protein